MNIFKMIHISLIFLLTLSIAISILSCSEDENIIQKPVTDKNGLVPVQARGEGPGDAWQIAWIRVDTSTLQETLTSEHIYDYDILEKQDILAVKVLNQNGRAVPNARVEWTLLRSPNMVGYFIETDDPGFQKAAPQIKVDNTFAITFTNEKGGKTKEMKFKCPTVVSRDGEQEPFSIDVGKEGETWVVVTSPRKGLTDIVAYCPNIVAEYENGDENPNPHKIFATKIWNCYDWNFPPSRVNNCKDLDHTFTTKIFNHLDENMGIDGIGVRYTIQNPQGSFFVGDGTEIWVPSDINGEASVTLQATKITPEPIKILVEILLRDGDGIYADREIIAGCAIVTKKWGIETLKVTTPNPCVLCLEDAGAISRSFKVTNLGDVIAEGVELTIDYPEGITVVDTDEGMDDGDKITWDIGTLHPVDPDDPDDNSGKSPTFAASSGGTYFFTVTAQSKCAVAKPKTWTVTVIDIGVECLKR